MTGLTGEVLDLIAATACIAAISGVAAYEISHLDDRDAQGNPVSPAVHTEMARILNLIKDADNIPEEKRKLLNTKAYERMGHEIVSYHMYKIQGHILEYSFI